jgi:hypothetical protein
VNVHVADGTFANTIDISAANCARFCYHSFKTFLIDCGSYAIQLLEPVQLPFVTFAGLVFVLPIVNRCNFQFFDSIHALLQLLPVLFDDSALLIHEFSNRFKFQISVHLHRKQLLSADLSLHLTRQLLELLLNVS